MGVLYFPQPGNGRFSSAWSPEYSPTIQSPQYMLGSCRSISRGVVESVDSILFSSRFGAKRCQTANCFWNHSPRTLSQLSGLPQRLYVASCHMNAVALPGGACVGS